MLFWSSANHAMDLAGMLWQTTFYISQFGGGSNKGKPHVSWRNSLPIERKFQLSCVTKSDWFIQVFCLSTRSICSWANAPYYYLSNMMRADSYKFFLGNGILQSGFPCCFLQPTQQAGRKFLVFLTRHHLETVSGEVPCLREHGLTRDWTMDNDFTVRHANR